MLSGRAFAISATAVGGLALLHALLTWSVHAVVALFISGACFAFIAEWIAIRYRLLEHHVGPTIGSVPVYLLFAWPGTIYIAFRVALVLTDGWYAVLLCAIIATGYDLLTDHYGVEAGNWSYSDRIPGPVYKGVPWWNYAGWFTISVATATIGLIAVG